MNNDKPEGISKQQTDFVVNLLKYYEKNGEDKLLQDIFKNVSEQKKGGKLKNEEIQQFVKNVSPLLSSKQKEKLNQLVSDLLKM